jgi:hypothetical protein
LPPAGDPRRSSAIESLRIADTNNIYADVAVRRRLRRGTSFSDAVADPGFTLARVFDGSDRSCSPSRTPAPTYTLRCGHHPGGAVRASDVHELPVWCERKLVDYAIYRAMTKGGELARAQSFLATYEQGLPDPAIGKDRIVPGPITIVPIIGPFELDPDAAHV